MTLWLAFKGRNQWKFKEAVLPIDLSALDWEYLGSCLVLMKSCLFECGKLCFIGKEVVSAGEIKANERK